jgi:hypothetical protein
VQVQVQAAPEASSARANLGGRQVELDEQLHAQGQQLLGRRLEADVGGHQHHAARPGAGGRRRRQQ